MRELRVQVATLVGLNENPAEIVGWDVIPAALARTLIESMHGACWQWVICDRRGSPINTGTTCARPSGGAAGRVPRDIGRRAGIVELHLRVDDLPTFTTVTGPHHAWAAVITDIITQHRATTVDHTTTDSDAISDSDANSGTISDADANSGTNSDADANPDSGEADAGARRRTARAGLRRRVQARDRCCTHPACRAPASRTDQDHAIDHARGGSTTDQNLGSCCRHDHRLKHDGGWRLTKPAPEVTAWVSPLGHTYVNRPPPVMSTLPKPWPAPADSPATAQDHGPRLPPIAAPHLGSGSISSPDVPPF